jgi:ATP-dependent Clp protease ATP-binding subunit ClpC
VFERFTDASRSVVALAQDECRLLGHDAIGTVHLVAGLTRVGDGATEVLAGLGMTTASVRAQITRMMHPDAAGADERLPLAAEAEQALGEAGREALRLGHDRVQPGHLLLALLDVHDGNLPVLFARLGVAPPVVRDRTTAMLTGQPAESVIPPAAGVPAAAPPACPRCGLPISLHVSDTGDGVQVASCRTCGAVVGAWPA